MQERPSKSQRGCVRCAALWSARSLRSWNAARASEPASERASERRPAAARRPPSTTDPFVAFSAVAAMAEAEAATARTKSIRWIPPLTRCVRARPARPSCVARASLRAHAGWPAASSPARPPGRAPLTACARAGRAERRLGHRNRARAGRQAAQRRLGGVAPRCAPVAGGRNCTLALCVRPARTERRRARHAPTGCRPSHITRRARWARAPARCGLVGVRVRGGCDRVRVEVRHRQRVAARAGLGARGHRAQVVV